MKKLILGFTIGVLLTIPVFAFSASNLADRLEGKILLAVEDSGKTYYVHEDGNRYRITSTTAHKIFKKLALGITNEDLELIPIEDVGIDPEGKDWQAEYNRVIIEHHKAIEEWSLRYFGALEDIRVLEN